MTKEEKQKAINALRISAPVMAVTDRVISYILKDCPEYGLMDGFVILGF